MKETIDVSWFISLIGDAHKEGKRLADQIARGTGDREIALALTNLEQARHWAVDAMMLLQGPEHMSQGWLPPLPNSSYPENATGLPTGNNFIANSGDPEHQVAQKQYEATLPPGVKIRGQELSGS